MNHKPFRVVPSSRMEEPSLFCVCDIYAGETDASSPAPCYGFCKFQASKHYTLNRHQPTIVKKGQRCVYCSNFSYFASDRQGRFSIDSSLVWFCQITASFYSTICVSNISNLQLARLRTCGLTSLTIPVDKRYQNPQEHCQKSDISRRKLSLN